MAADVRSVSSTSYATRTDTTITAPSGIVNGDVLLLIHELYHASSPPAVTLPSGFAYISADFPHTIPPQGTERMVLRVAVKEADGESGDYTVTHGSATTQGAVICLSGATATGVLNSINQGTLGTVTGLSITPARNDSVVLMVGSHWDGITLTTPPAGTTPTFSDLVDGVILYVTYGLLATAQATGDKSITADGTGAGSTGNVWHASLVVIEADGPAGVNPRYADFPRPRLRRDTYPVMADQ